MTETKRCPKCKLVKPVGDFGKNKAASTGLKCYCMFCEKNSCRDRYRKNSLPYLFRGIMQRCYNKKNKDYPRYGAVGIKCFFKNWAALSKDLGPKPSKSHTVDRIDSCGHYEKGNVRWATRLEQSRNRKSVLLCVDSVKEIKEKLSRAVPVSILAAQYGVSYLVIRAIKSGRNWAEVTTA